MWSKSVRMGDCERSKYIREKFKIRHYTEAVGDTSKILLISYKLNMFSGKTIIFLF